MKKRVFPILLIVLLIFSGGCGDCGDNGDDPKSRLIDDGDDSEEDTSNLPGQGGDDDDTDLPDQYLHPDQIWWPRHLGNVFSPTVVFKVADDTFDLADTRVFVDEQEIVPPQKMFSRDLADGTHHFAVVSKTGRYVDARIEFYVKAGMTEKYEINAHLNQLETVPRVDAGSGILTRLILTNTGNFTLVGVWPFSPGQPDFRYISELHTWFDNRCLDVPVFERKMWLMYEYIGRNFYVSDSPMPGDGPEKHYYRNTQHLHNLRTWGYGNNAVHANLFNGGAYLCGWDTSDLKDVYIFKLNGDGHIVTEQTTDGEGGLVDPYGFMMPRRGEEFISRAEIVLEPNLLFDLTEKDQFGENLGEKKIIEFED